MTNQSNWTLDINRFFNTERVVDPLPLMTYGLKLSLKA